MWKTFIGNFISDIKTGVGHKNLTLSNTKRETDLGMLVGPFDKTFHPLHLAHCGIVPRSHHNILFPFIIFTPSFRVLLKKGYW